MSWRYVGIAAGISTAAVAEPAAAQSAAINPQPAAKLACESQVDGRITPQLLAEAILISANVPASRVLSTLPPAQQNRAAYLERASRLVVDPTGLDPAAAGRVLTIAQQVALSLKTEGLEKILVAGGADLRNLSPQLLFSANSPWSLRCVAGEQPATVAPTSPPVPLKLVLRKSVDDLAKAAAEGASSFSVGFVREKTLTETGERKTSTDLSVNGAVGIAIGKPEAGSNPLYAYGEYTLSEKRSELDPAPPPDPTADPGKDDVDVLEIGLAAPDLFTFPTFGRTLFWQVRGRTGGVLDFAKDARRVFGNVQLEPGVEIGRLKGPIGFGHFGREIDLGLIKFRTRLRGWFEGDLSHVIEKGTSKLDEGDELLALGGVLRLDVAPPLFAKHGVIASAQRRHLWTVAGTADDIERWDLEAGYRFLIGPGVAVDIKTTYAKGEERKSLDDQDIWKIEFGLKL